MKNVNFSFIGKSVLLFACGLFVSVSSFGQIAAPGDYSSASQKALNASDLTGKYVIKTTNNLYMSPIVASDNDDPTIYATKDITSCYAFDIAKDVDGYYTIQSGDHFLVWDHDWLIGVKPLNQAEHKAWKINVLENDVVTFERASAPGKYIKYEVNGNLGLYKFYSDAGADREIKFTLLKISTTGTQELNITEQKYVKVFPKPTSDYLNISNMSDVSVLSAYNMSGKQVAGIKNSNKPNLYISVANWGKGIYVLKMSDSKGYISTSKFEVK